MFVFREGSCAAEPDSVWKNVQLQEEDGALTGTNVGGTRVTSSTFVFFYF